MVIQIETSHHKGSLTSFLIWKDSQLETFSATPKVVSNLFPSLDFQFFHPVSRSNWSGDKWRSDLFDWVYNGDWLMNDWNNSSPWIVIRKVLIEKSLRTITVSSRICSFFTSFMAMKLLIFVAIFIYIACLINGQQLDRNKTTVLVAPRGTVTSPGYDGKSDYPGSQEVHWLIASRFPYVSVFWSISVTFWFLLLSEHQDTFPWLWSRWLTRMPGWSLAVWNWSTRWITIKSSLWEK